MKHFEIFQYSHREELANWVSHGLGVIFGLYVLVSLIFSLPSTSSILVSASCLLYALSLIALYSASTFYHIAKDPGLKKMFKKADHICIYYLIAGSYSPFLMIAIGGDFGQNFFYLVWSIAIAGTLFKLFDTNKFKKISLLSYLGMGWLAVILWKPLVESVSPYGLKALIFSGAFYTIGTVFYVIKKIPFNHAVWHLFVLAGSVSHYIAVRTLIF